MGKGESKQNRKKIREKETGEKKEIKERAMGTAHVIGCFILRANNFALRTFV
jgi:hypothetical protein